MLDVLFALLGSGFGSVGLMVQDSQALGPAGGSTCVNYGIPTLTITLSYYVDAKQLHI